ncbi:bifunctional 5,10-methylenetetrahydrofolate dehydrogenase/5,10-methenyltetrahydrofolate cyclohydrolase [Candidatus Gracilibacteria bacterium]|nr:bifunctional 5,10-methylenetetrahydrofolate dehydrogenase/5,10-methenyltetrahydrofolate cyclohydrolase [Candidatus Gracilibacteria bacterium]
MTILDGKKLSEKIKNELKNKIQKEKIFAHIGVILIGDNPASKIYVKYKEKFAEEIGVKFTKFIYDEKISEKEILNKIEKLNKNPDFTGIFVQLPVPKHISVQKIIEKIDPKKDVDGFSQQNIGEMFLNQGGIFPATPKGILRLLDEYKIEIEGKNAVVIGRSNIVGKPLSTMLLNRGATITTCHSKTKNLNFYLKNADLIIVAVGRENFLDGENIKKGAVIIDVGINPNSNLEIKSQIVGDCNFEKCCEIASFITPVPGGVGPMTIASLMENSVKLARNNKICEF